MQKAEKWFAWLLQPSPAWLWPACAVPLWLVLVYTGYADPAAGFAPEGTAFLWYFPISALIVLFSLLLNWVKGYLVLHFCRVDAGMAESARILGRTHALMLLAEALATLALFALRASGAYPVAEQAQLFGHEFLYAVALAGAAYVKGATLKRALAAGVLCFLACSAWLLLSVIAAVM